MHAVVRFISSTDFFFSQDGEGRLKKSILHLVIKYLLVLKIFALSSWIRSRKSFCFFFLSLSQKSALT